MTDDVTGARKGDYLILGTLGAGGMGKVYKVRNTLSDRVEAMKVLLPDLSEQQELADRFLREIKVLASLHHPNIAELRTALTIGNQLVMIMEYVEGTTLASRLQQGDMRYADALACFDQVLAALSCAHAQRIVHRDIKPANVMLAPYGIVKLMDFGIARSGNDMGLTMTGTTLGSVAYMSPEQVRCEPLDGRSDLYSVGVSLYETVTGQRPYVSDNNFEVMQAHLQVPPTPPIDLKSDIPPGLNQLILMAMAKNPAQRFQTADAMRGALRSVAPFLGEPTPFAPEIPESTLDMSAQQTPFPARPSTPRSVTARPVAQQPITARPVTATTGYRAARCGAAVRANSFVCAACADDSTLGFGASVSAAASSSGSSSGGSRTGTGERWESPRIVHRSERSARGRGVGCCWVRCETLDGFAPVRELDDCYRGQSGTRGAGDADRTRGGSGAAQTSCSGERETACCRAACGAESSAAAGGTASSGAAASCAAAERAVAACGCRATGSPRGGAIGAENCGFGRATRGAGA